MSQANTFNISSSIAKKQIVAVSGLILISFIIIHLIGNLFIFWGPAALNGYSEKLHKMPELLLFLRLGLIAAFATHIIMTISLVIDNYRSCGGLRRYEVENSKSKRSLSSRLMALSGLYIFVFLIAHLLDFTFIDVHGPKSIINGQSLGIYGVVVNAFLDPVHSLLYILAVSFIGLHLHHGVQSVLQSFGFNHPKWTPLIKKTGAYLGLFIAVGFSSIPVYVLCFLKI